MPEEVTLRGIDMGETAVTSSYTFIQYADGDVFESSFFDPDAFDIPPTPHSEGHRLRGLRTVYQVKQHSDERQFWEDMLEQKFITWKECLAGMRACRKREKQF